MIPRNRPVPPHRNPASSTPNATPPGNAPARIVRPVASRSLYKMKQKRNNAAAVYGFSSVTILLLIALRLGGRYMLSPSADQQLSDEAYQVNKSCPRMIDDVTRLDRVETQSGKKIRYFYTIISVPDAQVLSHKDELIEMLRTRSKTDPDLIRIKSNGIRLHSTYRNASGGTIFECDF